MDSNAVDIWFGPGAEKGVFGAGVALGLQQAIESGQLAASRLRLYGASVGCLTTAFLASGNADCGLQIFQEETRQLAKISNLVPSLAARSINGVLRLSKLGDFAMRVPNLLNLDHVFRVMEVRTPNLVDQLRQSAIRVHAETVDGDGTYRHTELRSADQPLQEIRLALNLVPFAHVGGTNLMDSAIHGYGFAELVRAKVRPLVIVLNTRPTSRSSTTTADLICAAMAANARVSRHYLRRRSHRHAACVDAQNAGDQVLMISPNKVVRLKDPSSYKRVHTMGREAARQIIDFMNRGD